MGARSVVAAALAVAIASSGCSLVMVRGAPSFDPGTRPVPCTQSRAAPIIDLVPGLGFAGIGIAIASTGDESAKAAATLVSIPFLLAAIPFLGSSLYGFRKVSRCRAMNAAPAPMTMPPPAPQPLAPPAPAPQPPAPPPAPPGPPGGAG